MRGWRNVAAALVRRLAPAYRPRQHGTTAPPACLGCRRPEIWISAVGPTFAPGHVHIFGRPISEPSRGIRCAPLPVLHGETAGVRADARMVCVVRPVPPHPDCISRCNPTSPRIRRRSSSYGGQERGEVKEANREICPNAGTIRRGGWKMVRRATCAQEITAGGYGSRREAGTTSRLPKRLCR